MSVVSIPEDQTALLLPAKGGALIVTPHHPVPTPSAGEVLVQLAAVGLNPIDAVMRAFGVLIERYPAILGVDGAGVVVAIGEGVEGVNVGDRVAVQGSVDMVQKSINGTFAQYVITAAKYLIKIPESMSSDGAATMPCTLPSAALVLYNQDPNVSGPRLVAPWAAGGRGKYVGRPALVLGGSSSLGQYAIQFLRLSGFAPIVTTASPQHAAYLTSLGATHVLDRTLAPAALCAEALTILPKTDVGFPLVFDAVSLPETIPIAYKLASNGADVIVVSPTTATPEEGKQVKVHMARGMLSIPTNAEIVRELLSSLPGLLACGDIKPNRTEVLAGGLGGISAGLDRLAGKRVSGVKLVVRPLETV